MKPVTIGQRLRAGPHRFDPFQAARVIEQGVSPVGGATLPADEPVRFTTLQTLALAASPVSGVELRPGHVELSQAFLGLTGPMGVLPQVFSELVVRAERMRNRSVGAFHDVFVHRLASLFLRAAGKYRLAVQVQADRSAGNDPISGAMLALAGFGTPHLRGRTHAPEAALLYFAGLFAAHNRSAAGLETILAEMLGCTVQLIQFQERWIIVPATEQSGLPSSASPPQFNRLGIDTFAGARVRDGQGAFRIRIGPVNLKQFSSLLPGSPGLAALVGIVRLYAGAALAFDLQIVLSRQDVPRLQLSTDDAPRLGWTSWAAHLPPLADREELVLDPDRSGVASDMTPGSGPFT